LTKERGGAKIPRSSSIKRKVVESSGFPVIKNQNLKNQNFFKSEFSEKSEFTNTVISLLLFTLKLLPSKCLTVWDIK